MIPTDTIDKLGACFDALSSLGATLTEDDWKTLTDLPGWTVQDNLSHLIGTERSMQGLERTAHRADPREYVRNAIGEAAEHEVDARRGQAGAEVLREWNDVASLRMTTLRSADDTYFDREAMTPTGPGTVADFLDIRVLDCWIHEQDMRRAVGKPGNLSTPAAAHTIDRLIRTIPIVVGKRAATPEGEAVVIDITGGVRRHIVCEVRGGRAAIVAQPSKPPLCSITLDTEDFLVLATGRRPPDAIAAQVDGDAEHAAAVLSQFNMMI